jgi:hypothetical protein
MNQFTESIASLETSIKTLEAFLANNTEARPLHELERDLLAHTQAIGRAALAQHISSVGTGEAGTHLDEGREWRYHGVRQQTYRSIFGPVPIRRAYYHHHDKGGFYPLDAALALPKRSYSYLLQEAVLKLDAYNAYDTGHETMFDLLGVTVPKAIAEQIVVEAATDVSALQASLSAPTGEGEVLVVQADGKGIPMVRPAVKEMGPKMRRKKGEKRNKKKMATVFTLYTLNPEPNTEPKALNRKTYAFLGTKREAFKHIAAEVAKRSGGKKVLFLSDGDPDLAALQREFFPKALPCVDWIHVVEYLWMAAYVFYKEGSPQALAWVKAREGRLVTSDVATIIRGLKASLTKNRKLKAPQRKTLAKVIGYLEGVKDRLPYKAFLAAGYPIGTGSVEGACRHLICDRMERAGMHWKEAGAQAMLHVRSVHINGEAKDFNEFRVKREHERLYGRQACNAA